MSMSTNVKRQTSSVEGKITPAGMLALFKGRRSIRRYRPDSVPDEFLAQVLEAGQWAPSASNRQPWDFIVVRDAEMRRAVAEYSAYFFIKWAHVAEAPVIIVLCGDTKNRVYRQFLHEDIGLAGGQMLLQAAVLGLGSCWVGGVNRKALGAVLRLPDHIEVVGLLTLGFPAEEPEPPARKPLAQIVHYDVYGNRQPGGDVAAGRVLTGLPGIVLRKLSIKFRG